MKRLPGLLFDNKRFWIAVAVLVASASVEYYGRACGFNLTSDSVQYLSSARSFQSEGKFLGDDGSYNPYWPPLFPMLLSMASNPLVFLAWINLICKITIAGALFYLATIFIKSELFRSVFLISSMLSVYMIMISVFVWTELFFLALILLNVCFAINPGKRWNFFGLIITGFLLCILRNAGLFWIGGLCAWMMMDSENFLKKNAARVLLFFLLSTSGLWAWNIYNTFLIPANFTFYERPFLEGFFMNISLMAGAFTKMIVPAQSVILQILIFIFAVVAVLWYLRPVSKNVFAIVVITYAGGFMVLGKLDAYEMDRYLAVITPFVFLLLLMTAEKIIENPAKLVRYGVMVCTIIWLSYTLIRTAKNVQLWHERSCFTESVI